MTDQAKVKEVVERLAVQPTVHLPDMGPGTVNVAASIRQLMVDRADALAIIESLSAEIAALREGGDVGLETVLVPREPTDEMVDKGRAVTASWLDIEGSGLTIAREKMRRRYRAMVEAAPKLLARTGQQQASEDIDPIAMNAGMEQWRKSLKRPDLNEEARVRGALDAYERSVLAGTILARTGQGEPQTGDMVLVPRAILRAIAEGYKTTGEDDRFIVVENPDFEPDNGKDPNLVIDTFFSAGAQDERAPAATATRFNNGIVEPLYGPDALTAARAAGAADATGKIVGWLQSLRVPNPTTIWAADAIQAGEHLKEKG